MSALPFCDLDSLAAAIPDGAMLAVPADTYGVAMAATRALVRRAPQRLQLVCVPTSGIQADVLIGAGGVAQIDTSAVSLGELGTAPRFAAGVRDGSLRVLDATCPAIHAGLQASQKGLPFMPVRGILGSDLLAQRRDWKVIDNPFAPGDRIVAVRAIKPDVAFFHALCADRRGNVLVARSRDLLTMAQASRAAFVTVEELVDGDLALLSRAGLAYRLENPNDLALVASSLERFNRARARHELQDLISQAPHPATLLAESVRQESAG